MDGGFVRVVFEDVPAAESQVSRPASGTKSLILGLVLSVRFPSRIGANWVREPTGRS